MKRRAKFKPRLTLLDSTLQIIWHGNSLVFGQGSSPGNRVTDQFARLFPFTNSIVNVVNAGSGGRRILAPGAAGNMVDDGPGSVDNRLSATKTTLLICYEMTNELTANGDDPVLCWKAWIAYCSARRAAAAAAGRQLRILLMTCVPYAGGTTDASINAKNQVVLAANNIMRARWSDQADYFFDMAEYKDFGAINAAARANGGIYTKAMLVNSPVFQGLTGQSPDQVHFGDYGYGVMAQGAAEYCTTIMVKP